MKTLKGQKFVCVKASYRRTRGGWYTMFRAHVRSTPAIRKRVLNRDGLEILPAVSALVASSS